MLTRLEKNYPYHVLSGGVLFLVLSGIYAGVKQFHFTGILNIQFPEVSIFWLIPVFENLFIAVLLSGMIYLFSIVYRKTFFGFLKVLTVSIWTRIPFLLIPVLFDFLGLDKVTLEQITLNYPLKSDRLYEAENLMISALLLSVPFFITSLLLLYRAFWICCKAKGVIALFLFLLFYILSDLLIQFGGKYLLR